MKRNMDLAVIGLTAALAAAVPAAQAAADAEQPQARIHFVSHGGIRDWQADGNRGLFVQDRSKRWYYVRLATPAFDLQFASTIGIIGGPTDTFDRWSSILVSGQRYMVQSVTDTGVRGNKPPRSAEPDRAR